ncbi:sterol desaturase family protein [Paucibacter sp. O1-1]|nr:sterol desaturase family protein [Paucibacter sp. O1-1]MDA3829998.1 sterol desaturase family protein [Paucibacter sp. O1-1]
MNTLSVRWLRRLAFPVVFVGVGWLAAIFYAPHTASWLMPLLIGGAGLILFALERYIPYEAAWNSTDGSRQDLAYLALSQLTVIIAEAGIWGLAMIALSHASPWQFSVWPDQAPIVVQVLLALAVGDFLPYLYHRISHETGGFLWRVHAIHHAPDRLYTLNFARFHPINAFLTAALTLLPLALLGVSAPVLFIAGALRNVHGVLSHANVDFRLGPLNWLFSMAEVHRWHHAKDITVANGNYGATLLVWDWLFGTRRHPAGRVGATDVGVAPSEMPPTGLSGQICHPFAKREHAASSHCLLAFRLGCCLRRT